MPTQAERIARLEADSEWIKAGLEGVLEGQTKLHEKMDAHMEATPPANGGVVISINKKTLGLISLIPLLSGGGGIVAVLEALGIIDIVK